MERQRARIVIYVDLDPVPGTMHSVDSAKDVVNTILQSSIGHYNPVAVIASIITSTPSSFQTTEQ